MYCLHSVVLFTQLNPNASILLVGCHCHQVKKKREMTYHTAREFADKSDIPVIELVCEEEGINVELAFMTLVNSVLSKKYYSIELCMFVSQYSVTECSKTCI